VNSCPSPERFELTRLRVFAADNLVRSVITAAAGDFGATVASYLASVLYAHVDFVGAAVSRPPPCLNGIPYDSIVCVQCFPAIAASLEVCAATRREKDGTCYEDGQGPGLCCMTPTERHHVAELLVKYVPLSPCIDVDWRNIDGRVVGCGLGLC
jgi:hypothetical protein